MDIEFLRDLIIVLSGIVITLVFIFIGFLVYSLYTKVNRILKSLKTTAAEIEALTTLISDEVSKPLIQTAGIAHGLAVAFGAINKIFRKGD